MESPQHLGNTEECSSSESGWTMYIASPMHEDEDDGYVDDDIKNGRNAKYKDKDDDDTDDSMASDASSGPIHNQYGNSENDHEMIQVKNYENHNKGNKFYPNNKKSNKQIEKRREEEERKIKLDKKEEQVLKFSKNGTTSFTTGTQARKLKWFGKGK